MNNDWDKRFMLYSFIPLRNIYLNDANLSLYLNEVSMGVF